MVARHGQTGVSAGEAMSDTGTRERFDKDQRDAFLRLHHKWVCEDDLSHEEVQEAMEIALTAFQRAASGITQAPPTAQMCQGLCDRCGALCLSEASPTINVAMNNFAAAHCDFAERYAKHGCSQAAREIIRRLVGEQDAAIEAQLSGEVLAILDRCLSGRGKP